MQSTQTHLAVTAGSTAPSTGTPGKSSSASAIAISHKTLIMFVILVIIESLTTAAFTKRILKRIHTECYLMSREVTSGRSMFFKYSSCLLFNHKPFCCNICRLSFKCVGIFCIIACKLLKIQCKWCRAKVALCEHFYFQTCHGFKSEI